MNLFASWQKILMPYRGAKVRLTWAIAVWVSVFLVACQGRHIDWDRRKQLGGKPEAGTKLRSAHFEFSALARNDEQASSGLINFSYIEMKNGAYVGTTFRTLSVVYLRERSEIRVKSRGNRDSGGIVSIPVSCADLSPPPDESNCESRVAQISLKEFEPKITDVLTLEFVRESAGLFVLSGNLGAKFQGKIQQVRLRASGSQRIASAFLWRPKNSIDPEPATLVTTEFGGATYYFFDLPVIKFNKGEVVYRLDQLEIASVTTGLNNKGVPRNFKANGALLYENLVDGMVASEPFSLEWQ